MSVREITTETTKVQAGTSRAVSSHLAKFFHLISPYFLERLAERLTVGGIKYGTVQWRQGINDAEYVTDRYNHFWQHLLAFAKDGNAKDDNLGAMVWALHCLSEVERLAPEALQLIVGRCDVFGAVATVEHEAELQRRAARG